METVCENQEEIFYETRDRLHSKGKGKGKGGSRTYGLGAPGFGRGGGYLEHRKMPQAACNGRGFDRPWQQRQGSRLSLSDVKSKSRCHRAQANWPLAP